MSLLRFSPHVIGSQYLPLRIESGAPFLPENVSLGQSGVDAKTLSGILGHTNASFTLDTYTHVTKDMQKQAANVVGGFMEDILGKGVSTWQRSEKPVMERSG